MSSKENQKSGSTRMCPHKNTSGERVRPEVERADWAVAEPMAPQGRACLLKVHRVEARDHRRYDVMPKLVDRSIVGQINTDSFFLCFAEPIDKSLECVIRAFKANRIDVRHCVRTQEPLQLLPSIRFGPP